MKSTFWFASSIMVVVFSSISIVKAEPHGEAPTLALSLDSEIHDAKLRAKAGAQSRLSSSLSLYYSGGSAAKPFGDERPRLGGVRLAEPVSVSGNVGLRYRWDKNESLFFSTGYFQSRPFHSRTTSEQFEMNTPQLSYNNTFAYDGWQISSSGQLMITTLEYMKDIGHLGSLGYSLMAIHNLWQSEVSAGLGILLTYAAFDNNDAINREMQNDYGLNLSPTIQYQIFKKAGLFSSLNLLSLMHYRSEPRTFKMENSRLTQNLGLGISATRDIFIAPDITFELEDPSFDTASVNLSITANL